jgi:hypothetical protein
VEFGEETLKNKGNYVAGCGSQVRDDMADQAIHPFDPASPLDDPKLALRLLILPTTIRRFEE